MQNTRYKNSELVREDKTLGLRSLVILQDSGHAESPRDNVNLGTLAITRQASRYFPKGDKYLDGQPEADAVIYFPVYGYAHGGVAVSTQPFSCVFDSGLIGCYSITAENWEDWSGKKWDNANAKLAQEIVESELKDFQNYANGEVYGYAVDRLDPETGQWLEVESCFGFLGYESAENASEEVFLAEKKRLTA